MPTRKIRALANVIVFAGWMLPAALARIVDGRADAVAGAGAARIFSIIAGGWAFVALAYGLVLAMRMRRGLGD